MSDAEREELLRHMEEIREHLGQLSLHVVKMFRLVDEVLEKMQGRTP
jgi:hypothetical protein